MVWCALVPASGGGRRIAWTQGRRWREPIRPAGTTEQRLRLKKKKIPVMADAIDAHLTGGHVRCSSSDTPL